MYELIEIEGKQLPIRFGMNALRLFCKETKTSLNEFASLANDLDLDKACVLILCGLKDGARKAGKECSYKVDDIADILDDDFGILETAMGYLRDSFDTPASGNSKGDKPVPKKKK
jgi:hypothetical protein